MLFHVLKFCCNLKIKTNRSGIWLIEKSIGKKHIFRKQPTVERALARVLCVLFTIRRLGRKSRHVDFSLEKPTRRFSVEKADTSIFRWKSGHVGTEIFSLLKKISLINVWLKKQYQKIHINKVQSELDDCPVTQWISTQIIVI